MSLFGTQTRHEHPHRNLYQLSMGVRTAYLPDAHVYCSQQPDIETCTMSAAFMLTPPTSAASPSPSAASALCQISRVLPTPRKHPLQSGSAKEVNLIHYLDDQLERVYRRHEKRLVPEQRTAAAPSKHDDAPGYESMEEVVQDLDPVVDIVWVSKTRKFIDRKYDTARSRIVTYTMALS